MTRRRLLQSAALLAVAAILAVGAWAWVVRPVAVQAVRMERDVPIRVFGLGTIEARVVSQIGFEASGALVELNADHGDRVRRGTVLARLYNKEEAARVAKSEAALAQARANLTRARAKVASAEALLAQKRSISARRQALVRGGTTSEEAAEDARAAADIAAAELAVARSDVTVAEAAIKDALAQVQMETVLLDNHVLRAPYDALVISRRKELGAVVAPGEAIFTLIDPETVWALAYVDEARAGGLRVGQPAEVRLRSLPRQTFRGHVTRIDIESDRVSEERRVYIACDRCPESFHLGEQAEVFVTTTVLDKALLVPETAVEGFDGKEGTVWTVEDGELQRRKVAFGHRTLDSRLEIVSGLPDGARVVSALRPGLREERAAKVEERAAP